MIKWKKVLAILIIAFMVVGTISGCNKDDTTINDNNGSNNEDTDNSNTDSNNIEETAKDTVTALLPPVTPTFQENFDNWEKEFNELYPNITLEIEATSWEDATQKLDVQVQAGSPPDLAFVGAGTISKYIDTGLLMDISNYATSDMLNDFDQNILNYYRNGDGLYGMPSYVAVHSIGGNREKLEAAGIDWQRIQKEGWTYDEFREAIKAGVEIDGDTVSTYGFVFACAGVAASDYINIFVKNAGMPDAFDSDLKYAYTSKNFLKLLEALRTFIDDGSMPKELSAVDAGKRWNMFLTGQTMITGKGMSVFERSAKLNNEKISANDGSAVEGSVNVDYIILPIPTFFGYQQEAAGAIDGYAMFRGTEEPTDEHLSNVAKAMYFLTSGKIGAMTCNDLYLSPITESGIQAMEDLEKPEEKNEFNTEAERLLATQIPEARTDITPELGAAAQQISDLILVPKFQALLANEITPQQMYDAVKTAAIEAFGEDGIVVD